MPQIDVMLRGHLPSTRLWSRTALWLSAGASAVALLVLLKATRRFMLSRSPAIKTAEAEERRGTTSLSSLESSTIVDETELDDHATQPARKTEKATDEETPEAEDIECWEFEFPSSACGRLVGKSGRNIKALMTETNTKVVVIGNDPSDPLRTVRVKGQVSDVKRATAIIRERFPREQLVRIGISRQSTNARDNACVTQMALPPAGGQAGVVASHIVAADHLFFLMASASQTNARRGLDTSLANCYSRKLKSAVPSCSTPPAPGTYVAASIQQKWHRGRVTVQKTFDKFQCDVFLVDLGGTLSLPWQNLKILRDDLFYVPFQAMECHLANVQPLSGAKDFSLSACAMIEQWTTGQILEADVVRYHGHLPSVELYSTNDDGSVFFINRELVNLGLARWVESPPRT